MKYTKFLLVAALALGVSCGSDDDDEEAKAELEGTWTQKGCSVDGTTSSKESLTFAASTFVAESTHFDDATCTSKSFMTKTEGTYTVPGDNDGVEGAKNINFTYTKVYVTPLSETSASAFNTAKFFGFETWKSGEQREVTGVKQSETGSAIPLDPTFNIYTLSTDLCLGTPDATNTSKTEELRPVKVSTGDTCLAK